MINVLAAEIGAASLWLLYGWLLSSAAASYLSHRKGYGERPGLASGLLLAPIGVLIWLLWPPREESLWKKVGPFGRPKAGEVAAAADREEAAAPHAEGAAAAASQPTSGDVKPESADVTERT